jgi:hypothetical protein
LKILKADCCDLITFHRHLNWSMAHQATEEALGLSRAQYVVEDLTKDLRLNAQIAYPGCAWIEVRVSPGRLSKPPRLLISGTHHLPELPVPGCDGRTLHPGMLIRRNGLTGQLATNPAPGFGQNDMATEVAGRQCGRDTAASPSDN